MLEKNKNVVRRFIEETWNKGSLSFIDECLANNYRHHDSSSPDFGMGPQGEKKRVTLYRSAFPDLRFEIEDLIAEADTVVARWSARGTHKGELNGIAPTGRQITTTGVTVLRLADGKFVEGWVSWDALGLLTQLGAVPELAAT